MVFGRGAEAKGARPVSIVQTRVTPVFHASGDMIYVENSLREGVHEVWQGIRRCSRRRSELSFISL
jgi:hypothetical protein